MTRAEAIGLLSGLMFKGKLKEALDMAIASLETDEAYQLEYERTTRNCFGCKYSKDNHSAGTEECHLCMWENQYTPTTKNDLGVDCISRDDVWDVMQELWGTSGELIDRLMSLPSVTPQEPKTGHCKDCKWWRDSDGEYRRGARAESMCPINTKTVFLGEGYCYRFDPQKNEDKE